MATTGFNEARLIALFRIPHAWSLVYASHHHSFGICLTPPPPPETVPRSALLPAVPKEELLEATRDAILGLQNWKTRFRASDQPAVQRVFDKYLVELCHFLVEGENETAFKTNGEYLAVFGRVLGRALAGMGHLISETRLAMRTLEISLPEGADLGKCRSLMGLDEDDV